MGGEGGGATKEIKLRNGPHPLHTGSTTTVAPHPPGRTPVSPQCHPIIRALGVIHGSGDRTNASVITDRGDAISTELCSILDVSIHATLNSWHRFIFANGDLICIKKYNVLTSTF